MGADGIRAVREVIGRRDELRALAEGVTFRIDGAVAPPFRVPAATLIELSPGIVNSGPALAVHLRHALEIAIWHRVSPAPRQPAAEVVASALACWTTLQYVEGLCGADAATALDASPSWLRQLHRLVRDGGDRSTLAADLVTLGWRLLALQGGHTGRMPLDAGTRASATALTADLLAAALPTEQLLTTGGDSRVVLDAASRRNKYGCAAVPQPATAAFSSCTASSISDVSYRAAENARQELLGAVLSGVGSDESASALVENVRRDLARVIGLDRVGGAAIVLAASGTDCEYYALQLALHGHDSEVVSIVMAPDEIGGGSVVAAGGRHFDALTPLAGAATAGTPLEGLEVDRVRVESLPIRNANGLPIPMGEIDDTVERAVQTAIQRGARVLLHVVDGSKTGMRAPSLGLVRRLQDEIGDALTVVVDAAQMRTRTQTLVDCVAAGWMVMISGSKFFGGPPFSGALLVPPHLANAAAGATRVPAGFGAYLSACDVPQQWRGFRASLPATPNLGLMVRWRAALAEMQSFHALSCAARDARLGECRRQVQTELDRSERLEIVPAPVGDRDQDPVRWDGAQTIFTFLLKRRVPRLNGGAAAGERSVLTYDEAWQVYVWLNRDVSAALPPWATAAERRIAAQPCHIGQPVKLKWRDDGVAGALRIALGARSVRAGASDAMCVVDKIDVIMRYWQQLTARPAAA